MGALLGNSGDVLESYQGNSQDRNHLQKIKIRSYQCAGPQDARTYRAAHLGGIHYSVQDAYH